jgi:penicillin amidase
LLKSLEVQEAALQPYVRLLREWDGVLSRDARAGPLYAVWLQELQDDFYRLLVPTKVLPQARTLGGLPVMLAALENPDPAWFGNPAAARRDRLLRTTLTRAVEKLKGLLPGDPAQWSWGRLHTATLRHPLATLGAPYEKAFNLGPVPRPGDVTTPNNTRFDETYGQVHGASYRQLFDLADWDRGLATSTPGQSGQPGSPHYSNLLPLWADGEYFPLVFSRARVEGVTRHRLLLRPR